MFLETRYINGGKAETAKFRQPKENADGCS
jgi:hypothetical protein